MIIDFRCKETQRIWEGTVSKKLPYDIQPIARRKLRYIYYAVSLEDLRIPPSNHLERLRGDRKGQYSIRINKQWRICFKWVKRDAYAVEIVDYH